ncbi:MAG TPA: methyl-accepting chemotaxis protein [Azospirillaceae bacterium]|nr:methyl-accepting chemotaxis protein [Azospirillaceae bacterium]
MNLKIGHRIHAGSGLAVAMMVAVVATGHFGLGGAADSFQGYRGMTRDSNLAAQVKTDVMDARLGIKDFLLDPSLENRDRVGKSAAQVRQALVEADQAFDDPERRQHLERAQSALADYEEAFARASELMLSAERVTRDTLDMHGPRIDRALNELMALAFEQKQASVSYHIAQALRSLLLAREYSLRFAILRNLPTAGLVEREFARFAERMAFLADEIKDPEQQAMVTEATEAFQRYREGFAAKRAAVIEAETLVQKRLNPAGATVDEAADAIGEALRRDQEDLGSKADAAIAWTQWFVLVFGIVATLLAAVSSWLIGRSIRLPILAITEVMRRLAGGDRAVEVPSRTAKDEVGDMARAVEVFKQNAIEAERLAAEQEREREAKEARARAVEELIARFEGAVGDVLRSVGNAAGQLDKTAEGMSAVAEEASRQAAATAVAAEETSANVQTVAAAAEQMNSSVEEIARQVTRASAVAAQAVDEAERTDTTVRGLAEAAERIGNVVQLIQNIASQTNLLALNATIEAARAGEAGKGFAVVANEVKTLASQTAKATEEISSQIAAMQGATGNAVGAIRGIGSTIGTISEITTAISSAVEEQSATTAEIARNVAQAAVGTQEVSSNIVQVTEAASQAGVAATEVLGAAAELNQQADGLKLEVHAFLEGIRAA